ncbi:hypothetical protein BpHYR1_028540 [Brachionus plicatilis]|uniref:Uncharacterized protein n=1 Tax=Brachionus plicatilis TaxID=10195 RepID=A0A3M7PD05_BRAPC|nr:hypothetical protein BpHYR1_028540 [Brachionus plicatilis]
MICLPSWSNILLGTRSLYSNFFRSKYLTANFSKKIFQFDANQFIQSIKKKCRIKFKPTSRNYLF